MRGSPPTGLMTYTVKEGKQHASAWSARKEREKKLWQHHNAYNIQDRRKHDPQSPLLTKHSFIHV
jgi:hypothetical protein